MSTRAMLCLVLGLSAAACSKPLPTLEGHDCRQWVKEQALAGQLQDTDLALYRGEVYHVSDECHQVIRETL